MGAVREDMFGNSRLNFALEEVIDNEDILALDYAAGSIGVELNGVYELTKITLTAQQADTRVDSEAIRVFVSDENTFGSFVEVFGFNTTENVEAGEEKMEMV